MLYEGARHDGTYWLSNRTEVSGSGKSFKCRIVAQGGEVRSDIAKAIIAEGLVDEGGRITEAGRQALAAAGGTNAL